MRLAVGADDGAVVELECADTLISSWTCREILAGRTYPYLPFVEDVRVVFDVGANCGATTVHFARRLPDATVHSFEPARGPREILERNARAYPNVSVHAFGFHALDQDVPLYHGEVDSGLGSVVRGADTLAESEPVTLRAAGPWAVEQGIDRIDLLKVDTEGCEVDVLRSLAGLLPTVKVLYVEHDSEEDRRIIDDLLTPTHELYVGLLLLGQGECVYLRRDLADLPVARSHLAELARQRGFTEPRRPAPPA